MRKFLYLLALLGSSLNAAIWVVDADGSWDVASNWDTNSVPNGIGQTAMFETVITAPHVVSLSGGKLISEMRFDSPFQYTISGLSNVVLDALGMPDIQVLDGSHIVDAPLQLIKTTLCEVQPGAEVEFRRPVTGTGGIDIVDGGRLSLTAANSFFGPVRVGNGTLAIGTVNNVLPNGKAVSVEGSGVFQVEADINAGAAPRVTLDTGGQLIQVNGARTRLTTLSGSGDLVMDSVTAGAVDILGNSTFGGTISGGIASASLDPNSGSRFEAVGNNNVRVRLTGPSTVVARIFAQQNSEIQIEDAGALGTSASPAIALDTGAYEFNIPAGGAIDKDFILNGKGELSHGALRNLAGDNTVSRDVTLGWSFGDISASDVAIGVDGSTTLSLSGVVTGAQELQKVGVGSLRYSGLSGNNYTGLTRVSQGDLYLDKTGVAAILRDFLVEQNGTLRTDQPNQYGPTTVGTVDGGFYNLNGQDQVLSRYLFYAGTLTQAGGMLTVSNSGNALTLRDVLIPETITMTGGAGAEVLFEALNNGTGIINNLAMGVATRVVNVQSGSAENDLEIRASSGVGFTKMGKGSLLLSGTQSHLLSLVDLAEGRTVVNGDLTAGSVDVEVAAILGGNGTITAPVSIFGALNTGSSVGTLTVIGDVSFNDGSTHIVDISPTASDLLFIQTGNFTISGNSTIEIVPEFGAYPSEVLYTVISAPNGTRTGEFRTTILSLPLFSPQVNYLANAVQIQVQLLPFSDVVTSGNPGRVAVCLDELASTATGDLAFVIQELQFLPTLSELIGAIDQLQPSPLKGLALTQEDNALHIRAAILNRLYATNRRACCCMDDCCRDCSWTAWLDVGGSWYDERNSGGRQGFNSDSVTATVGVDFQNACDWIFGISGSYSYSNVDWKRSRIDGNIHSGYGSVYAGWSNACFFANAILMGAYNHYDEKRKINFLDINRKAKSDFGGGQFLGHLDLGVIWACNSFEIRPYVGVDYVYLNQNSFTESGAQSINLHVKSSDYDLVRAEAGGIFSFCLPFECINLTLDTRFAYIREERFRGKTYTAGFEGTDCTFKVDGLNPDRNIFSPSVGFLGSSGCSDCFKVGVYYDGEFAKKYRNNRVDIFFLYTF